MTHSHTESSNCVVKYIRNWCKAITTITYKLHTHTHVPNVQYYNDIYVQFTSAAILGSFDNQSCVIVVLICIYVQFVLPVPSFFS